MEGYRERREEAAEKEIEKGEMEVEPRERRKEKGR